MAFRLAVFNFFWWFIKIPFSAKLLVKKINHCESEQEAGLSTIGDDQVLTLQLRVFLCVIELHFLPRLLLFSTFH